MVGSLSVLGYQTADAFQASLEADLQAGIDDGTLAQVHPSPYAPAHAAAGALTKPGAGPAALFKARARAHTAAV